MFLLFICCVECKSLYVLFTDRTYEQMTYELIRELRRYETPTSRSDINVYILQESVVGSQNKSWSFAQHVTRILPVVTHRSSSDYFERIAPRFEILRNLLDNRDYSGIMAIDSDVAVFRNIAARLERHQFNIVVQQDVPCRKKFCVNAGVMWLRANNDAVKAVLDKAIVFMQALHISDQDALQMVLDVDPYRTVMIVDVNEIRRLERYDPHFRKYYERRVTVLFLNSTVYVNGFVYQVNQRLHKRRVHLVHVNWAKSTAQKQSRLTELRQEMALVSSAEYPFLRTPSEINVAGITKVMRHSFEGDGLYDWTNMYAALAGYDPLDYDDVRRMPCYTMPGLYKCLADNQRNRSWRPHE